MFHAAYMDPGTPCGGEGIFSCIQQGRGPDETSDTPGGSTDPAKGQPAGENHEFTGLWQGRGSGGIDTEASGTTGNAGAYPEGNKF